MDDLDRDPELVGFGERLMRARLKAGYSSCAALSRACGYDQQTIWRHESGTRRPSPKSIARYAEVLGVTPAYLQFGVGDPTPSVPRAVLNYVAMNDVHEETRSRLMRLPWLVIVGGDVTEDHVAEMRRLIDRNLAGRASYSDERQEQLPLGRHDVPDRRTRAYRAAARRSDAAAARP